MFVCPFVFLLCIWMLILYISVPPISKIRGKLFLSCMSFCNSIWNFYLANNVWTVNARVWYMSIPSDKTFPWVSTYLILWPWSLPLFIKIFNLLITFEQPVLELLYYIFVFLVTTAFYGYQHVLTLRYWSVSLVFFENFKLC